MMPLWPTDELSLSQEPKQTPGVPLGEYILYVMLQVQLNIITKRFTVSLKVFLRLYCIELSGLSLIEML